MAVHSKGDGTLRTLCRGAALALDIAQGLNYLHQASSQLSRGLVWLSLRFPIVFLFSIGQRRVCVPCKCLPGHCWPPDARRTTSRTLTSSPQTSCFRARASPSLRMWGWQGKHCMSALSAAQPAAQAQQARVGELPQCFATSCNPCIWADADVCLAAGHIRHAGSCRAPTSAPRWAPWGR